MPKSAAKTVPTKASVDAFIAKVENETRRTDALTLLALMKKLTKLEPVLWGPSLIGFGQYHYKYESGREGEMFLIGFSPRKTEMVVYVVAGFDDYEPLLAKLGKHRKGSSCLYFKRLADIDMKALEALMKASFLHMKEKYSV